MSELADEWWERQDHPLLNNVILSLVFEHLSGKDLKECRLVSKTWNVLTIPFTRNALEVTILDKDSTEDFVEVLRSNNLGIPYGGFKLGSTCITEGIGRQFLQLCGDTIKSIGWIYGDQITVEDLSENENVIQN